MSLFKTDIACCSVRGVRLCEMRSVRDDARGHLMVVEFEQDLPFLPRRCFMTYQIPSAQTRGQHAHKECAQFLICVHGRCQLAVDDGTHREEFRLDRPTFGVYVPPMIWASEFDHSEDSVLMVLASHPYAPEDYIRDYREFVKRVNARMKEQIER